MIVLHGGVTAELAYNPLLAIINDDVASIVGRTIEGFEVNDETMAVELIEQVGEVRHEKIRLCFQDKARAGR